MFSNAHWPARLSALLCACLLIVFAGCPPAPPKKDKDKGEKPKAQQQKPETPEPSSKEPEEKPAIPGAGEKVRENMDVPKPEPKGDEKSDSTPAAKPHDGLPPEPPKADGKVAPDNKTEPTNPEKASSAPVEPKITPAEPPRGGASVDTRVRPVNKAELLVTLPDSCNTPDGMTLMPDHSVIVSVPNFNDQKQPPLLIKITPDNKVEPFFSLPPHPDTGRMGPMGIRVAPSGDLYLADNQLFHGKDGKNVFGKSRVVRIAMKDGKPTDVVPVATGLNVANGITIHDGSVYITETILVPESKPLVSGVFRFKLGEEDVKMKEPLRDDPHLLLTIETKSQIGFGADGICFDGKGNLYVSDFSDGVIYRVVLDKDGKVAEKKLFAKADFMKSCDGMDYDPKTEKIYSADLMGNGVDAIDMDGKVTRLAEDPENDGSGGKLRAACEALVRGDTIVVANMDFPVPGAVIQKYSKPATISVIKLK